MPPLLTSLYQSRVHWNGRQHRYIEIRTHPLNCTFGWQNVNKSIGGLLKILIAFRVGELISKIGELMAQLGYLLRTTRTCESSHVGNDTENWNSNLRTESQFLHDIAYSHILWSCDYNCAIDDGGQVAAQGITRNAQDENSRVARCN
jgi:hypothetical protein